MRQQTALKICIGLASISGICLKIGYTRRSELRWLASDTTNDEAIEANRSTARNLAFLTTLNNETLESSVTMYQNGSDTLPLNATTSTFRFKLPSIEERVRYYMGSWYDANPASDIDMALLHQVPFFNKSNLKQLIEWKQKYIPHCTSFRNLMDTPLLSDRQGLESACKLARANRVARTNASDHPKAWRDVDMKMFGKYAENALEILSEAPPQVRSNSRMILQFGDSSPENLRVPILCKSRRVNANVKAMIGPLNSGRHWKLAHELQQQGPQMQPPWRDKRSTVVWRGGSTGGDSRLNVVKAFFNSSIDDIDIGLTRLRDVHAKEPANHGLMREGLSVPEMLGYKYLLSLEGNDVASGLKWMLYSNSVVIMPPPTKVSWAMEDWLIPFVHYIPLKDSAASNLPEMLAWARANDDRCRDIARQSTRFIERLFLSPHAQANNKRVLARMVERHQQKYGQLLNQHPVSAAA